MYTLKNAALAAIMLLAVASAQATDFTFDVTTGDWNVATNWDPPTGGPPGSGDTATILNGQTCEIGNADQAVKTLTINSGGTVKIKGKRLTIPGTVTNGLVVNGTLIGEQVSGTDGSIYLSSGTRARGSGTITASGSGRGLRIEANPESYVTFYLGDADGSDGITMKGSVTVDTYFFVNNGDVLVDSANDTMTFGPLTSSGPWLILDGDYGEFRVTAGLLRFARSEPYDAGEFTSPWYVQGGTLELTEYARTNWVNCDHHVTVSGGTLQLNFFFHTFRGLTFSGGSIRVKANHAAAFEQ